MPVPPEYTEALEALKAYRTKILTDLVGARVIAGLDASHDSMTKYSGVIDGLSIVPYMFARVREKAVALQLKGLNVGTGKVKLIKGDYIGGTADYPMKPPYQVPQRKLPQVDIFAYEPVSDLDLLDETNTAALKSALLIQADSGTFRETPDAENALYDYYQVVPNLKRRSKWSVSGLFPIFPDLEKVAGENVRCYRQLIKADTYEHYLYCIVIWFDATLEVLGGTKDTIAVGAHVWKEEGAPDVHANLIGQRIAFSSKEYYATIKHDVAARGFAPLCAQTWEDEPIVEVWRNTFKLTILVNDPTMGYTEPPVGDYEFPAFWAITCIAHPNVGYKFVRWERDGVPCSEAEKYIIVTYKDYELKAVFAPL